MKKWMHRGMGMVLVLLMLSSLFTFSAYADETESVPEETGFVIDKESAIYAAFDEAAAGLSARQILVYDSTNERWSPPETSWTWWRRILPKLTYTGSSR